MTSSIRAVLVAAMTLAILYPLSALAADGATATDAKAKIDGSAAIAASVPVATKKPVEPKTVREAFGAGKDAIAAAKSGNWWLFAALVVSLLLAGVKFAGTKLGTWWRRLGRWRYVIPPVLSLAAALLATFQGGVSVDAAVGVFTASWAMSSWQELWEHGILGKPRKGAPG